MLTRCDPNTAYEALLDGADCRAFGPKPIENWVHQCLCHRFQSEFPQGPHRPAPHTGNSQWTLLAVTLGDIHMILRLDTSIVVRGGSLVALIVKIVEADQRNILRDINSNFFQSPGKAECHDIVCAEVAFRQFPAGSQIFCRVSMGAAEGRFDGNDQRRINLKAMAPCCENRRHTAAC